MHHVQLRNALLAPNSSARVRRGAGGGRGDQAQGVGLFAYFFFSKLNSVKQQDADGFAVVSLNRLKR